jgi:hypothetical protein
MPKTRLEKIPEEQVLEQFNERTQIMDHALMREIQDLHARIEVHYRTKIRRLQMQGIEIHWEDED